MPNKLPNFILLQFDRFVMKIFYSFFIILLFGSSSLFAQPAIFKIANDREWKEEEKFVRLHHPKHSLIYSFDFHYLMEMVKDAPTLSDEISHLTLSIPDANGSFQTYWIYNNPTMEPELAAKNPNIKSLKAISTTNKAHQISISLSDVFGLHAIGTKADGTTYYMDSYSNDLHTVMIYNRTSLEAPKNQFKCLTVENSSDIDSYSSQVQPTSMDNKRRNFRLALACTVEYATFHLNAAPPNIPKVTITQKKNIVLAALNVSITRINHIFERDLNVHLNLVSNNSDIIFINSDQFSNNNPHQLISQSQTVIDNIIGTNNYDIGHTFSTGGGGLALLGSVCNPNRKAMGITGSSSPVGDPFDVDYVAHEMGHQFGANHTFNNSCQSNRHSLTAVEPGSGSTIMSYAGICWPNIQNQVIDYFHYISIREMHTFIQWASCAQQQSVYNNAPIVPALESKTIPYGTPFILNSYATDPESDQLTYTFEQIDPQVSTQPPSPHSTTGPNFKSIVPSTKNYRSFPDEATVLSGTTDPSGIVSNTWERLATTERDYHFVTLVRDNHPMGSRVTYTPEATIKVANTGPFVITYPDNNPSTSEPIWYTGSSKTITWNVAGTTANNINVSYVNILISTDNGQTYTIIAENTANDGSETIMLPTNLSNTYNGRIKIEAVDNIFYTVSKALTIWDTTTSNEIFNTDVFKVYPNPAENLLNIAFSSEKMQPTHYFIFDLSGRLILSFENDSRQRVHQLNIDTLAPGTYILTIDSHGNKFNQKFIKH